MSVNQNLSLFAKTLDSNGDIITLDATTLSGRVPSGSLTGSYSINITGDASTIGGTALTALASNTYLQTQLGGLSLDGNDAATLDSLDSTHFLNVSNMNAGTLDAARLTGTYAINISGSADRFGGALPAAYASNTYIKNYVDTEIAAITLDGNDATTLDGLDSTHFLNATNLASGTVPSARLSGSYGINITGSADSLGGLAPTIFASNTFMQSYVGTEITTALAGTIDADTLNGQAPSYYLDAANLTGTVASARLTGSYSINISGSADRLGGELPATYASNTYMQSYVGTEISGKLDSSSYTAADVLTKVKTVDGAASGLDADLLDGLEAVAFMRTNTDTSFTGEITGAGSINISGTITGPTTDTLLVKDSSGSTLKTIRGV